MGRLIDADKLKAQIEAHEIIKKFSITEYECGHNVGLCIGIDEIDEAETIDAIPVAWIKEKIQTLRNENSYTSYHLSECFKALLIDWRRGKKREQTD